MGNTGGPTTWEAKVREPLWQAHGGAPGVAQHEGMMWVKGSRCEGMYLRWDFQHSVGTRLP